MTQIIWSNERQVRDRHIRHTGEDYFQAFLSLLPWGQAWPREPEGTLWRACRGLAIYWGWIDGRAADFLERESDPTKTIELLPEWERAWGLPDPCFPDATTIGERQKMLVTKMVWMGGQSREYFERLMKWLGFEVNIKEYAPFMAGISEAGDTRPRARQRYDWVPDRIEGGVLIPRETPSGWVPRPGDWPARIDTATGAATIPDESALPETFDFVLSRTHDFKIGTRMQVVAGAANQWMEGAIRAFDPATNTLTLLVDHVSGSGTASNTWTLNDPGYGQQDDNYRWYIGPPEMRYAWSANAGKMGLVWFRAGSSEAGVNPHLQFRPSEDLQCLLNRWKPAHTALVMDFSHMTYGDPMEGTP